jgi:hypothetical protein
MAKSRMLRHPALTTTGHVLMAVGALLPLVASIGYYALTGRWGRVAVGVATTVAVVGVYAAIRLWPRVHDAAVLRRLHRTGVRHRHG